MFKKVFATLAAFALVFGAMPKTKNLTKGLVSACSYVCCEHDGDVWSN